MSALEQLLASEQARRPVRVGWGTREQAAWAFDLDALNAAARELELRWSVIVGCAEYPAGRTGGRQSNERDEGQWVHKIRVRRRGGAGEASRTLWHELAHCAQAERLGVDEFDRQYDAHGRKGAAYWSNPFEVEARAYEARAADRPLVAWVEHDAYDRGEFDE